MNTEKKFSLVQGPQKIFLLGTDLPKKFFLGRNGEKKFFLDLYAAIICIIVQIAYLCGKNLTFDGF